MPSEAQDGQRTNIKGRIVESKANNGLAGATIHVQGSTNTVITDDKGAFNLTTYKKIPVILYVSYVGYQTQEVTVTNSDPVIVTLAVNSNQLSEIAVIGYGTQRRSDVTGSVASVPKEILNRPSSSFDNLLQGSVAGVVVSQSSGQPGATATIRIRGGNSLSFGNDPLYVIDGFIYYNDNSLTNLAPASGTAVTGVSSNGLSTINPSDIESIDILKDASATAIYGSRGANGVVIITTKRGTKGSIIYPIADLMEPCEAGKTLSVLDLIPEWTKLFDDLYNATPTIQGRIS